MKDTWIDPSVLLSLPFDHYQRYLLTQRVIRYLWPAEGRPPLHILDVGGQNSSLKHFLPDDEVVSVDPLPPSPFAHTARLPFIDDGYVRGSGAALPFASGSFDIVCAHDTLEHVPEDLRPEFIAEMARVSRDIVVLNGPVYSPSAAELERRIAEFSRRALDWDNPYLAEHIEQGLPPPHVIRAGLDRAGLTSISVPNGSLSMWLTMMALRHYLIALPHPEALQEEIDRAYNKLISPRDFAERSYRELFVATPDPDIARRLPGLSDWITGNRETTVGHDEEAAFEMLLQAMESHAAHIRAELAGLIAEARMQAALVARREHDLAVAEARLEAMQRSLGETQEELARTWAVLHQITGSMGYRLLEGYRRGMRIIFPPNSIRGVPYRSAVRAMRASLRGAASARRLLNRSRRVIEREGWGGFRRKAWTRLTTRSPKIEGQSISYDEWIRLNEPDASELQRQRAVQKSLPYRPLVSIVTPVWNPGPHHLREAIESVKAQTYDNWELCLADGASTVPGVRAVLEEVAADDARIRVKYLETNRGIVGNSSEALALATGEFIAFLDHTDALAPNALWEAVSQINRDPATAVVYSDHDLISVEGKRHEPLFKPAWSPETILSANYATHFCVMRSDLVRGVGGLRAETEGAQDWDLLLRVSRQTDRIARVPKVLYHWRTDSSSTLTSINTKSYAVASQDRALMDHLQALGIDAAVERDRSGGPRLRFPPGATAGITLVIPTRHNRKVLEPCLRAIARSTYKNIEVIVIDNGGRTPERERWYESLRSEIDLRVLWWEGPFNYSAVNNLGAREARGEVLLFLNDDTEATQPDWLEEMLGWINYPGIGVVGAQLLWRNGRIQHGGDILGMNGFADHLFTGANPDEWTLMGSPRWYRNVSAVTGACLMIRRDLFERVGGFNEAFVLCGSDVELCLRVRRAGMRIVCTPFAGVLHHERATRSGYDDPNDVFTSFWHYQSALFGGDPYFNPNLSLFSRIPALRHPEEPLAPAIISPVVGRPLTPGKQGAAKMEDEATILAESCQILPGQVEATRSLHEANKAPFDIKSINWFIPDFESPFYGGIHTILRFADHFQREFGVSNRFVVMGSGPEPYIRSGIEAAFPDLGASEILVSSLNEEDLREIPYADATIATLWITAYAVSRFQNTRRKFYMIQDFEPIFYPAGTLSALSDATYRLGLYGICNTHTLEKIYRADYGGKAYGFDPAVDTSLFRPPEGQRHRGDTMTVFLYGRPGHWRNCYELAVAAIRRLKQRMKKKVRVVSAGSWVPSGDSESAYLVDNLGLLDYRQTAELYKTCDVGLTFSMSKHPSYLPLELMACGALVVTNVNPYGSWLLKDGENCLLAEPTAESLCAALERALTDDELRARLTENAVADIQQNRSDWTTKIEGAYRFMCNPEGL